MSEQIQLGRASQSPLDDFQGLTNLTSFQMQFWIGQQLQPEAPLFNLTDTFSIAGPIHHDHFQRAFQTLINHTDALRTVIEEVDGIPQQRVVDRLPYRLEYLDFSQETQPLAACQSWMDQRSRTPFELGKRLFDTALAKLAEDEFIWYLSIHHMISDGWSFYLIFQRMQALYRRSLEGRLDEPVRFPFFQSFIEYERAYHSSSQYWGDEAYWEHKLTREVEPLAFYGRTPAKRVTSVRRVGHALDIDRSSRLKTLARQDGLSKTLNVSLFNILAGVFAAYLYRISGNDYLSLGTPFLNRSSADFRDTVGLFMQVAPLRIEIAEGDTFTSLIWKVQTESRETAQHYRYTLGNHQNRLYDVIFDYHNVSFSNFDGSPVRENWLHSGNDGSSLSLHVRYPEAESLLLHFDFHPDVFDEDQQERAIQHFLRLLDAFLEDPDQPIRRVDLLSPEERRRILVTFNDTKSPFAETLCVHQLFEAQVERTPHAVAIVCPSEGSRPGADRQFTYRELNRRSNQLAHHLRGLGVGPETLVGIYMERSLEMMVALLGILKAGGAYLPLDPAFPRQRLAYMLQDSQAKVVVTQKSLLAEVPEHQARVLCMDADWDAVAQEDKQNLASGVAAGNLAYVIYTSGSTGRPKGVAIEHHNACALISWAREVYRPEELAGVLASTSICFDLSVFELFLTLSCGGKVILTENALRLPNLASAGEVTLVNTVPSAMAELIRMGGLPSSVCTVNLAGEPLSTRLVEQIYEQGTVERVYDLYGPSEATTYSTFALRQPGRPATIGRPIANTQIYLLDQHMQPVPLGVIGEVYIGGDGLARGYFNRPELTAEKFIPDPFTPPNSLSDFGERQRGAGARLYKTGDLARYLPDGNIEFLGRVDRQVKVRGFRIEPGEIEVVLGQHPAVGENVVIVREDVPGDKRLVAYLVPQDKEAPATSNLRSYLKEKLPDYMVPSAFVSLKSLPLSPNGKVDRSMLPRPDLSRPEVDEVLIAPRTPVEQQIAEIWAQVLKLKQVGVDDSFFELGGNSLLATQVISRLRSTFHFDLPLRSLFEAPTVAGLAERLEVVRWATQAAFRSARTDQDGYEEIEL